MKPLHVLVASVGAGLLLFAPAPPACAAYLSVTTPPLVCDSGGQPTYEGFAAAWGRSDDLAWGLYFDNVSNSSSSVLLSQSIDSPLCPPRSGDFQGSGPAAPALYFTGTPENTVGTYCLVLTYYTASNPDNRIYSPAGYVNATSHQLAGYCGWRAQRD